MYLLCLTNILYCVSLYHFMRHLTNVIQIYHLKVLFCRTIAHDSDNPTSKTSWIVSVCNIYILLQTRIETVSEKVTLAMTFQIKCKNLRRLLLLKKESYIGAAYKHLLDIWIKDDIWEMNLPMMPLSLLMAQPSLI